MSDYRQTDYDGSYYERELRRRAFTKYVKKKRRKAIFSLFILCIVTIGLVICTAFGIKYLATDRTYADASEYKEDIPAIRLSVCYNEYAPDFFKAQIAEAAEESDTAGESPEANNQTEDLSGHDYEKNAYQPVYENGLIIIDAGHGGEDGGAQSSYSNESVINLEIAYWVKEELMNRGYQVFMTRIDDTYVGLNARANLANAQDSPLAMVSIHQNAYPEDKTICGVEAHTYDREGCYLLGELLSKHVAASAGIQDRGVFFHSNLVVTSKTTMPSVIVECGYMTNDEEAYSLTLQDYQIKIARGIADALDEFISNYY